MWLMMVFVKLYMRLCSILGIPLIFYLNENKDELFYIVHSLILALRRCNIGEHQMLVLRKALALVEPEPASRSTARSTDDFPML